MLPYWKCCFTCIGKHLDSYDFSTLYTTIPHDLLMQALRYLINEAYKVRDSVFLIADHAGRACW